jgi:hypothetical protein
MSKKGSEVICRVRAEILRRGDGALLGRRELEALGVPRDVVFRAMGTGELQEDRIDKGCATTQAVSEWLDGAGGAEINRALRTVDELVSDVNALLGEREKAPSRPDQIIGLQRDYRQACASEPELHRLTTQAHWVDDGLRQLGLPALDSSEVQRYGINCEYEHPEYTPLGNPRDMSKPSAQPSAVVPDSPAGREARILNCRAEWQRAIQGQRWLSTITDESRFITETLREAGQPALTADEAARFGIGN